MKIITIASQKGGVAKTTTAAALASGLAKQGAKVLCIDLDPQANLTMYADVSAMGAPLGARQLLDKTAMLHQVVRKTDMFDLVPPGAGLEAAERDAGMESWNLMTAVEAEPQSYEAYDFIIVDTCPAIGPLTKNALYASDEIIIPTQAAYLDMSGMSRLLAQLKDMEQHSSDVSFHIAGILVTKYRSRTQMASVLEQIEEWAATREVPVLGTIRLGIDAQKAQAAGVSIYDYAPDSGVAKDYEALVKRFLDQQDNGKAA